MPLPFDCARTQRKGQMQKPEQKQLLVLLPGKKIPADEVLGLCAQFLPKLANTRRATAGSVAMSLTG